MAKTTQFQVRCNDMQKEAMKAKAKAAGTSLSDFVLRTCLWETEEAGWGPPEKRGPLDPERIAELRKLSIDLTQAKAREKEFQRKVNFYKNSEGMTTLQAEAAARNELGL